MKPQNRTSLRDPGAQPQAAGPSQLHSPRWWGGALKGNLPPEPVEDAADPHLGNRACSPPPAFWLPLHAQEGSHAF